MNDDRVVLGFAGITHATRRRWLGITHGDAHSRDAGDGSDVGGSRSLAVTFVTVVTVITVITCNGDSRYMAGIRRASTPG